VEYSGSASRQSRGLPDAAIHAFKGRRLLARHQSSYVSRRRISTSGLTVVGMPDDTIASHRFAGSCAFALAIHCLGRVPCMRFRLASADGRSGSQLKLKQTPGIGLPVILLPQATTDCDEHDCHAYPRTSHPFSPGVPPCRMQLDDESAEPLLLRTPAVARDLVVHDVRTRGSCFLEPG